MLDPYVVEKCTVHGAIRLLTLPTCYLSPRALMLPSFHAPPLALRRRSQAQYISVCSAVPSNFQTAAASARQPRDPAYQQSTSPPLPPHSAVVWAITLPSLPTADKLPQLLHTQYPHRFPTLSAAKRAVRRGEFYLHTAGKWRPATVLDRPQGGDRLARAARVEMASVRSRVANKPPELALNAGFVRYLDDDRHFAVVVKPAGVTVGTELREATFFAVGDTNRRLERAEDVVGPVLRRPVAVHRLDKVTGGLVIVALTETALRSVSEQFQRRDVQKTYRARVEGTIEFTQNILRSPVDGKTAETHIRVVGTGHGWTEVLLSPKTGRRHQLRVHMKALGHPILYDTAYGAKNVHPVLGSNGICLWAEKIAFRHPSKGYLLEVKADPQRELFPNPSLLLRE